MVPKRIPLLYDPSDTIKLGNGNLAAVLSRYDRAFVERRERKEFEEK
jgi:hypothetical protein